MQKLVKLAFAGVAATAFAGTAVAATAGRHVMEVALPNGGTAHIEYYGDVAPKVTIAPAPFAPFSPGWAPMAFPDFEKFDRVFDRLEKQRQALIKQMRRVPRNGVGSRVAPINVVSYGDLPAGTNSVSVVSVSNGGGTCTRTTEVTSQGEGKPPKVVTNVTGTCGPASAPPTSTRPAPAEPLDHT